MSIHTLLADIEGQCECLHESEGGRNQEDFSAGPRSLRACLMRRYAAMARSESTNRCTIPSCIINSVTQFKNRTASALAI
jgi:hypothetical protein